MHVELIREALHRQPFEPFFLLLDDGRSVLVVHPDRDAVSPHVLLVVSAIDEKVIWLGPPQVRSIQFPKEGAA